MLLTKSQLAKCIAEWERRVRENPNAFCSTDEMRTLDLDVHGMAAAELLFDIAVELELIGG